MTQTIERTHFDINDAYDVFSHLHELPTHFDRVDLMREHLPHWPADRLERAMPHFMGLSPAELERVITWSDPTGEKAARNVDAARAATS